MGAAIVQAHACLLDALQLLTHQPDQQALLAIWHAKNRQEGQQREEQSAKTP